MKKLLTSFFVNSALLISLIFFLNACSSEKKLSEKDKSAANSAQTSENTDQVAANSAGDASARKAPGFAIQDLTGSVVNWNQYKGKVVLVDFWATWCGPCRKSIPHLSDLYTQFNNKGFEVVGISLDKVDKSVVAKFAQDYHIPYTVLMGDMDLATSWGVGPGIPMAFLVDRQGNIVDQFLGYQDKSVFEKRIQAYL